MFKNFTIITQIDLNYKIYIENSQKEQRFQVIKFYRFII